MRAVPLIQRFFASFILVAGMSLGASAQAATPLRIDITKGNPDPMPIALPDLSGTPVGADIMHVVSAD